MFFSKIVLCPDVTDITKLSQALRGDGYFVHQKLWNMLASRYVVQRNFIYRQEEEEGWPCFYVVSRSKPICDDPAWHLETKPYSPKIRTRETLTFSLRANPVRAKRSGEKGKQARHDVIMDAKFHLKQLEAAKQDRPNWTDLIQIEGLKWLTIRAERLGFSFRNEDVKVDSYRQHQLSNHRGQASIRFSSLDYNGKLTVVDPEKFIDTLYRGIGHCKGFGCGMLLVRRL